MSAGDLAAVLVSVAAFAAFAVLLVAISSLLRSLRELRATLVRLEAELDPMLGELRTTVAEAGAEVDRVDDLLDAAETISARVDSASRLGYLAFRAPLIRTVAFFKGLGRGFRRLLGGSGRRRRRAARGRDRTGPASPEQRKAA